MEQLHSKTLEQHLQHLTQVIPAMIFVTYTLQLLQEHVEQIATEKDVDVITCMSMAVEK